MILLCALKVTEAMEDAYNVFTCRDWIEQVLFNSTETTFILPGMTGSNRYRESHTFLYNLKKQCFLKEGKMGGGGNPRMCLAFLLVTLAFRL